MDYKDQFLMQVEVIVGEFVKGRIDHEEMEVWLEELCYMFCNVI